MGLFSKKPAKGSAVQQPQSSGSRSLALPLLLVLVLAGAGYAYMNGTLEPGSLKPAVDSVINQVRSLIGMPLEPEKQIAKAPAKTSKANPMNRPAAGRINGEGFKVSYSEVRDGVLSLRQGNPANPVRELRVILFTKKGEIPESRHYSHSSGDGLKPHVHIAWKPKNATEPIRKAFTAGYQLELQFGQAKGNRLPGKIRARLPGTPESQVVGRFNATIKGFRLINGLPDLKGDANETLVYLALEHLLKDDPAKPIKDVIYKNVKYTEPSKSGRQQTGSLEMVYSVGNSQPTAEIFTFIKGKNGWRVSRR